MTKSIEIPDCKYPNEAIRITPSLQTPNHVLYLSNLDIRVANFSIQYVFLYKKSPCMDSLKLSLSRILVDYYPFAGRLRMSKDCRVEVDCNSEGALFAEGFLDLSLSEFLEGFGRPDKCWRKLLYHVDASSIFEVPPLIIQMIHLNCGGMILLTSINHSLCDAQGTSQFLNAWAEITRNPNANLSIIPYHSRLLLKSHKSPHPTRYIPDFTYPAPDDHTSQSFISQPFVPISITFTPSQIIHLKQQCMPIKCTSFEVLASLVWRAWVESLDLDPSLNVRVVIPINARKKLKPNLPNGFYGNGFVPGVPESTVEKLIASDIRYGVELIQATKEKADSYIRTIVDSAGMKRVKLDLPACLVISNVCKLGMEDIDFGCGTPVHLGPLETKNYCLFLPVVGDFHALKVFMSVPEKAAEKFECLLKA